MEVSQLTVAQISGIAAQMCSKDVQQPMSFDQSVVLLVAQLFQRLEAQMHQHHIRGSRTDVRSIRVRVRRADCDRIHRRMARV